MAAVPPAAAAVWPAACGCHGAAGEADGHTGAVQRLKPLPERVRTILSMGLFVLLSGYVAFSAVRLGWLLWQRFSGLA